jgi:hypothetical protein
MEGCLSQGEKNAEQLAFSSTRVAVADAAPSTAPHGTKEYPTHQATSRNMYLEYSLSQRIELQHEGTNMSR